MMTTKFLAQTRDNRTAICKTYVAACTWLDEKEASSVGFVVHDMGDGYPIVRHALEPHPVESVQE